jgi:hypothetical protein
MTRKLKDVKSLTMKVRGDANTLIDSLQIVVESWIEDGCDADATNIMLVIIKDYKELDKKLWKKKPFVYLYPNRDDLMLKPTHGFNGAIKIFDGNYQKLPIEQKKNILINKLGKFINDSKFMKQEKARYEKVIEPSQLGQGDGIFDAFTIEYDTDYYQYFMCISFD